jgi:two-component system response regulator DesR
VNSQRILESPVSVSPHDTNTLEARENELMHMGRPPADLVIIDDNQLFVDALVTALNEHDRSVSAAGYDAEAALLLAKAFQPRVLLMGVRLGAPLGFITSMVHRCAPATRIVLLGEDPEGGSQRLDGVWGVCSVNSSLDELIAVVARVASLTVRPRASLLGRERSVTSRPRGALSERELEVLELLAAGRSNAEIARALSISVGTVKRHIANLYSKLGVGSRVDAMRRGLVLGLLHVPTATRGIPRVDAE